MKKLLYILILGCFITISVGCSNEKASDTLSESEAVETATEQEKKPLESRVREIDTENTCVYDDSLVLTDAEYDSLNSYTAWFSQTFKINAAIVLTDDIGDSSPEEFAKNYYENYYSGDGLLFLINNDTGNDYLYRKGVPAKLISDSDTQMLYAEISPMLALEEYSAAAGKVLETAETLLPEHFTDRTGKLDAEKINSIDQYIRENSDENICIYYVSGTGDEKIEDFSQKRLDMFYEENTDAALLVIDGTNGNNYLCLSGNMNYLSDSRAEITKAVKDCFDKENGMDIEEAAKSFMEFVE